MSEVVFWAWAILVVVVSYFYGRENGRIEESKRSKEREKNSRFSDLVEVQHGDGNNCLPFYVERRHWFPIVWCPSCGAQCRETQTTREAAG